MATRAQQGQGKVDDEGNRHCQSVAQRDRMSESAFTPRKPSTVLNRAPNVSWPGNRVEPNERVPVQCKFKAGLNRQEHPDNCYDFAEQWLADPSCEEPTQHVRRQPATKYSYGMSHLGESEYGQDQTRRCENDH